MKVINCLFLFCLASNSFGSGINQSLDQVVTNILSETIVDRVYENSFKVGLSARSWEYTEYAGGEQFMQDSGFLKGFSLGYKPLIKIQNIGNFEFDLSGSYVKGGTDYDGGLQGFDENDNRISVPYSTNSKNSILKARLMLGKVFSLMDGALLIPKIGFQYRRLKNPELPEEQYDYTRKATYKTIPIALAYKRMVNSTLTFSSQILFHAAFSGKTYTQTSDVGGLDKDYIQKDGSGFEFSLDFALKLAKLNYKEFVISPYFSSWKIDDSTRIISEDRQFVSYEPENNTKTFGLDLSIAL